jgi:hypothetical protein
LQVDPDTGDVRVKHQIDYDRFPQVEFELLAIDEGVPSLTGTTTVTITVGDVNDGRPEFTQDFYSLEIASDEDIGHLLVTLNATDVDSSNGNRVLLFTITSRMLNSCDE